MQKRSSSLLVSALFVAAGVVLASLGYAQNDALQPYPWLAELAVPASKVISLEDRFPAPPGFQRAPAELGSYASWLRRLPLRTDRTVVHAYDGTPLDRPSVALLLLDVGRRDLMQCADSIIRLHAEYLWSQGRADEASYSFTSGDRSHWKDWRAGEQFVVRGNKVIRGQGRVRPDNHRTFRRWLDLIFTYAGTASLAREGQKLKSSAPTAAGDFFVDPGFPGHAVIVLDIVSNESGRRLALLAQGFMPAEDVHILGADSAELHHWFELPQDTDDRLSTPSWEPFDRSMRRRLPTGR